MFNIVAGKLSPEQITALESKFGFNFRPSASEPNFDPISRRQAKGKSLPKTESTNVPGTTSAQRTRPSNQSRDKSGYRQVTKYRANKVANETLVTRLTSDTTSTPLWEVRDRLMNPLNPHYQGNPVIDKTTKRPYK